MLALLSAQRLPVAGCGFDSTEGDGEKQEGDMVPRAARSKKSLRGLLCHHFIKIFWGNLWVERRAT